MALMTSVILVEYRRYTPKICARVVILTYLWTVDYEI